MYNGVINIYKEPGFTSFDVVAKLRGILKQKKIGHTGTLDPDAEGVLVVCLGKATKLCDLLTDKDKSYIATLYLGKTSDTEDATGNILSESEVLASEEEVKDAILSFVGEYSQVPPMYSAIKMQGKKLYELARAGQVVERQPRTVVIHEIEILKMELPRVVFRVSCGKGTYIRSLCRDIGEKIGCGGLMEHLTRNCVSSKESGLSFCLDDALTLNEIERLVKSENLQSVILNIEELFPDFEALYVKETGNKKLLNGNFLLKGDFKEVKETEDGRMYRVYDESGVFKAIYQYDAVKNIWKADKMFL